MTAYPDWVKKFRTKGTAIKKVGNSYYLYKHTSKYVPGKKYPQAVDHFIGVITPDGVVETKKKKVSLEDIEVFECGFSYVLLSLCPQKWKDDLKDDWYDVFCQIILLRSPHSYLLKNHNIKSLSRNISLQEKKLFSSIPATYDELISLNNIYLLYFDNKNAISKISDDQKKILDKYNIRIEGVSG